MQNNLMRLTTSSFLLTTLLVGSTCEVAAPTPIGSNQITESEVQTNESENDIKKRNKFRP